MTIPRSLRFLPALLCMAAIFWFSAQPGETVGAAVRPLYDSAPTLGNTLRIPWLKVGHVVGYAALGAALLYGFGAGRQRVARDALVVTLLYALADEFHQTFTPGRSAGARDVLIDAGAAGAAILVYLLILRLQEPHARRDAEVS